MCIEGIALEQFSAIYQGTSPPSSHNFKRHAVFQFFLLDNTKEHSGTTSTNSKKITEFFKNRKLFLNGLINIWENIDGCAEHNRCAT